MPSEAGAHRAIAAMRKRPPGTLACLVIMFIVISNHACAEPTEIILHAFAGAPRDGAFPGSGVIMDGAGNLYGTTYEGGTHNLGTIYKLAADGQEKVLHHFGGSDGEKPSVGLIMDGNGNLYGTTPIGGYYGQDCPYGCGAVFKLKPDATFKILYAFTGGTADGDSPAASLLERQHIFFGTTYQGGTNGGGTVFEVTPMGRESLAYSFDGAGGSSPRFALIADKTGNLYGTTQTGGTYGAGCVYKLAQDGSETVLHSSHVGETPNGGLLIDKSGNLYGTTYDGGRGKGTVYKITPDGNETVLYAFLGGSDGAVPVGTLIADRKGNLYGSTAEGGIVDYNCSPFGCGTVFKLRPNGTKETLYAFQGGTDGAVPSDLTMDSGGNLYGTAGYGGAGSGIVFEIVP